jgi:uncharacterized protein YkwD
MHRSDTPTRWSLASLLLTLILILPVSNVHAAGAPTDAETIISSTTKSPSSLSGAGYYYAVQPTDTLWDIAVAHGISAATLLAANSQLDPQRLQAGQKIFVPARPAPVPRKPAPPAPAAISTPPPEVAASTPPPEAAPEPAQAAEPAPPPDAAVEAPAAAPEEPAEALEEPPTVTSSDEAMPADPGAPETNVVPEPTGLPAEILELINAKRTAQGLPALAWSPELAAAAQAHADDCAQRNRGSHVGSDGAKLAARLARIGYAARSASENWANAQSVPRAFGMWWNEPKGRDPHRRNILSSRFTEIGIGVAKGSWGYYFVADFGGR